MSTKSGRLAAIRVWDGERDLGACDLAWEKGTFSAVTGSETAAPERLTLIPGLVDTHVHLLGHAGAPGSPGRYDTSTFPLVATSEELTLHGTANAQAAMRRGVTTLRDLQAGAPQAAIRSVFEAGVLSGPHLFASGPVGMTAGHMDMFTPPAQAVRPPTADSPDECRRLVRQWARAGLTGIKVATSGGVLSLRDRVAWRNHTRAELLATVDEAHALGMLVAAHAHSAEGIDIALEVGVDSIEHGTEMTADQAVVLAEAGLPVAPTLRISEMIAEGHEVSAEAQEKGVALLEHRDRLLRAAARAGVRFVLGTDSSAYFLRFGEQMAEVVRMAELFGWDPARALRAATSDAADSLAAAGLTGRVRDGLSADFVILEGRPDQDIQELRTDRIVAVVCRGELVAGTLPINPVG
jgi:imidazolonepropionase-like amidohydrolase